MLFASGKRPTRDAIKAFADAHRTISVSHDPLGEPPLYLVTTDGENVEPQNDAHLDVEDRVWLELLQDGLTFDLFGLFPGASCSFPKTEHRFDLDQSPGAMRLEGLHLVPGQHLAGAANSMPVMRGLIALARDLVNHFEDLVAVVWEPSSSVIGRRYFESVSTAWLDGGAFPALGLTAFRETIDGALQSVGLDFWIGQELRIEPPLSNDRVAATRLGTRLVNQLVMVGGIDQAERVTAPDGTRLLMRPSRNGRFVRVSRE